MPRDSAWLRKVNGDLMDWGTAEYQLASIFDALQAANYQRGGNKGKRPEPFPRPKGPSQRKGRSREEMQARMAALREKRAEQRKRKAVSDG